MQIFLNVFRHFGKWCSNYTQDSCLKYWKDCQPMVSLKIKLFHICRYLVLARVILSNLAATYSESCFGFNANVNLLYVLLYL